MNVLDNLRNVGRALPAKFPPIPFVVEGAGRFGHLEHKRALYINSGLQSQFEALQRDAERLEAAAAEVSNGTIPAQQLLDVHRQMSDTTDGVRAIQSMRSALSSWVALVEAKNRGKWREAAFMKDGSAGTVDSGAWLVMGRASGGYPDQITYNNIPGPAALDGTTSGALRLSIPADASESIYLTNVGAATLTNAVRCLVMAVDIVQGAGNVNGGIATTQDVLTTAHPRWTGGAGLLMSMDTTTAFSAQTSATITYVNQDGATQSTSSTTIGNRVTQLTGNNTTIPFLQNATGDYGVQSISTITFSTTGGAAARAAFLIYKPLNVLWLPTSSVALRSMSERATPLQTGYIAEASNVGTSQPFVTFFVSATAGVNLHAFGEFIWG